MKTKSGAKNLIIVLITALSIVLFSFLVVFILQKNKKECPQGYYVEDSSSFVTADGVDYSSVMYYLEGLLADFVDGKVSMEAVQQFITDMNATIYSVGQLAIDSKEALQAWANALEDGAEKDTKLNIKLLSDIDFDGEGFCVRNFAGTFDGNGHTIKNVEFNGNIQSSFVDTEGESQGSVSKLYSMFLDLPASATIKNLRLYQCGRINDGGISGQSFVMNDHYEIKTVAGLVGYAKGCKIQNCVIEDFIVDTKDYTAYINVSGVFAVGYAYIENCLVQGMEVEECNETSGIGPVNYYVRTSGSSYTSLSEHYYYAYELKPSDIYGCVVNNDASKILSKTHNEFAPLTYLEPGNYAGADVPETLYYRHSIRSCFSTDKNGFAGLDANFWHKSPGDEYNDGWPYLSSFITFNVFEFKLYYSTSGYISVNNIKQEGTVEIKVPKAVNITPAGTRSFTFYGYAIEAVPIDGYKFDSWGNSSSKPTTYVVFLSPENYVFKFATVGGVTPIMYHVIEPENHLSDVGGHFGGTITCSSTTKDGELIITYNVNNTFYVIYELSAKYALEDDGLSTVLNNTKIKNLENNATYTITPVLGRKSYNVMFN